MNKRWKAAFKETAKLLKISLTNHALPDITVVADMGSISKSDQKKFITDFRDVIWGLAIDRTLSDDGEWVDTRCLIGIIENNICKAIFCRGDGDLVHKGQILLENYDEEKLKQLISLGDIWTLGKVIGEKHDVSAPIPEHTVFNERDKGIVHGLGGYKTYKSYSNLLKYADWSIQPIFFIMKDAFWYVGAPKKSYGNLIQKGSVLKLDEVLKQSENDL